MKKFTHYFLLLTVIVTAGIGGAFVFAPHTVPFIFTGSYVNEASRFFLQFFGCTMFGFSVLNAHALRYADDKRLLQVISKANISSLTIGIILTIYGVYLEILTNYAWLFTLEHLFFWAGFVFLFISTRK